MNDKKFNFLEEHDCFYEVKEQNSHTVYRFKENDYRGIIGVPRNEDSYFWYKFFIKGDKVSYAKGTPPEELPNWFKELMDKTNRLVEERDRIRKLFKKQYSRQLEITK